MHKRVLTAIRKTKGKKVIAVLGLTFKPNTDDMRDSPSLEMIPALIKNNCFFKSFDPEGMNEAKLCFKNTQKK